MKQVIAHTFAWCLLAVAFLAPSSQVQAQDVAAEFIGSFQGQLEAVTGETYLPFGRIEFTVAKTGKASGKISLLGSKAYPFTATLTADGEVKISANVDVVKAKIGPSPLTLNLSVANDGTFTASGVPLSPVVPAGVGIFRVVAGSATKVAVFGKTTPCEWAGAYSLAFFDPQTSDTRPYPTGAGYGSATVSSTGILSVKGKLADGSTMVASIKPSATAKYSFQLSPYKSGGGFVTSFELTKEGDSTVYAVDNSEESTAFAKWSKGAAAKDKIYPLGFGPLSLSVAMNKWTAPDAKAKQTIAQVLGVEDGDAKFQFDFDLSGAGLDLVNKYLGMIPKKLTVDAKGNLVPVYGDAFAPSDLKEWAKIWTGKVDPKTGIYTGTLTLSDLVDLDGPDNNKVPIKFVKRKVTVSGILFNVDDASVSLAYGFTLVPPLDAKTGSTLAGSFEFGGEFQPFGFGKPDTGDIPPGTPGNYSFACERIVDFDWSNFPGGGGVGVTVTGSMKNIPPDNAEVKFTIAPDLSYIVFHGRKVPLVGNSLPVALVFSDATAKNYKNTLTISVYLNTATGHVHGIAANYIQLIGARYTLGGRTFNSFVPSIATYQQEQVGAIVKVP